MNAYTATDKKLLSFDNCAITNQPLYLKVIFVYHYNNCLFTQKQLENGSKLLKLS